ncbi:MAG: BrnT family toxin [Syntrophobacteraceae bacterium]
MNGDYEWDPNKARINRRSHGVSFADATTIFEDPMAITIEEQDVDGEERSITIGMDCLGRFLVVVYTTRLGKIRLISARKANKFERAEYERK